MVRGWLWGSWNCSAICRLPARAASLNHISHPPSCRLTRSFGFLNMRHPGTLEEPHLFFATFLSPKHVGYRASDKPASRHGRFRLDASLIYTTSNAFRCADHSDSALSSLLGLVHRKTRRWLPVISHDSSHAYFSFDEFGTILASAGGASGLTCCEQTLRGRRISLIATPHIYFWLLMYAF